MTLPRGKRAIALFEVDQSEKMARHASRRHSFRGAKLVEMKFASPQCMVIFYAMICPKDMFLKLD